MTEVQIANLMLENRETFVGYLTVNVFITFAVFFLAYVIRDSSIVARGLVFAGFLLSAILLRMTMEATNEGFVALVGELGKLPSVTAFSQGPIDALSDGIPTPYRIGAPAIQLINVVAAAYLLFVEKWSGR